MTQALYFIISALAQLVLFVFLLRFWLPMLRTDFRNPLAQAILRFTSPVIVPLRRVLPPAGRIDTATVVVLLVLQYLIIVILLALTGRMASSLAILGTAFIELAIHSIYLFLFAILISIVLSWVAPHTFNPIIGMINAMAAPVLRPFRRLVPPLGGLDISPIFAIILLQAVVILLQSLQPLRI